MQNCSIWVVVVSEHSAAICRNTNGASCLLRSLSKPKSENVGMAIDFNNARNIFASEIMMALSHGASTGAYDGVIVMASAEFIGELRKFRTSAVTRLLIGEIAGNPAVTLGFPCNDTDLAQDTLKYGTVQ
jgi:hypothetical protein